MEGKRMTHFTSKEISTDGIVGELFVPRGDGQFPAVVCIGGSSGGVKTEAAPLLAEAGFVALSLGYFGAPGLPAEFVDLPLEYFVRGIDWLLKQPMVRSPKVGVTGASRGSEAALQSATLSQKVGAVAAYVPSGVRWMGVGGQTPWTYDNKPLPYVHWPNDFDTNNAVAKVDRFNQILDDPKAWAGAEIAIEEASCPILLISGEDDQLWPSQRMANMIMERLKKHNYPHPYRHIAYPDAGHRIKVPGLDPSSYEPVSESTVTHQLLQLGGTFEGNKAASEQSWVETVAFFQSNL
jgi:dienelactone hydrolase